MKEEPASRSLSRRTLLGRVIRGLGVTLALGHVIPRFQAEEGAVSKNEAGHLIVHVARHSSSLPWRRYHLSNNDGITSGGESHDGDIYYFRKPGHGRSDDGHAAVHGSVVAKEQGQEVALWLWDEAVTLGHKGTAEHVTGVNLTPLKDLLAAVQAANIPIWVCGACAVALQIGAGDLVAGAAIKGMPDYIKAVAERERSIAF